MVYITDKMYINTWRILKNFRVGVWHPGPLSKNSHWRKNASKCQKFFNKLSWLTLQMVTISKQNMANYRYNIPKQMIDLKLFRVWHPRTYFLTGPHSTPPPSPNHCKLLVTLMISEVTYLLRKWNRINYNVHPSIWKTVQKLLGTSYRFILKRLLFRLWR